MQINSISSVVFPQEEPKSGLCCCICQSTLGFRPSRWFEKFKLKKTQKNSCLFFTSGFPRTEHGLGFSAPLKCHSHFPGGKLRHKRPEFGSRAELKWETLIPRDLPCPKSQEFERKRSSGSKALQLDISEGFNDVKLIYLEGKSFKYPCREH